MTIGDKRKPWLLFALITTVFWGIWGAFIEIPEKSGFPATLGYVVWAITMIPCAVVALYIIKWRLEYDKRSAFYGMLIGLTGAGGQLILFQAMREGPAYIVFPVISLFPVVTIFLSSVVLKETTSRKSWIGIVLALVAILLLSYQPPGGAHSTGYDWLVLAIVVFLMWGVQAFIMKFSNEKMKAESIFFYMMLSGVLLIPVAIAMTDFSVPIPGAYFKFNRSAHPGLCAAIWQSDYCCARYRAFSRHYHNIFIDAVWGVSAHCHYYWIGISCDCNFFVNGINGTEKELIRIGLL